MRTSIALAVALAALACTRSEDAAPARTESEPPVAEAEPREAPASERVSSGELDCPEGTRSTRLEIPAVDTVMTWCVREVADGREVQHGPWLKKRGGALVEEGGYRDGERHGAWTYRRGDGSKQSEGLYTDGRKSGVWSFWDADGELIRNVDYGVPAPEAAETESDPAEAEPEAEAPKTITVSLRLENAHESELLFALEPWAEEYDMPPGASFEVEASGPDTGDLVVESSEEAITVWAWEGSEVQLWVDGVEMLP